jgi:YspA, cpYpsA-related SLOG family
MKAAMGVADPTRKAAMTTDHDDEFEPHHSSSPTDQVLHELQLYGYRPFNDEPDPRPLPEAHTLAGSFSDIFDALVVALSDTRLEPDLEDLLWSTVNVFHRAIDRIERELDDNELAQQRSQREQDGSEVKSVELERLTAEGQTLIERRNAFELMRDHAADQFEHHTHSAWRPRKGSKVALTGGLDFNDHRLVWAKLDQVHAKHPDMVLLHGGSPKGAELVAAKWADNRKVPTRPRPSPVTAPRMVSRRWRCLRPLGRRSSPSSARSPSASRRSSASPEWPRPDQPDRAWRGVETITSTGRGRIRH